MKIRVWILVALLLVPCSMHRVLADICAVCERPFGAKVYILDDLVGARKVHICEQCIDLPRCFLCGVPVKNDATQLADGRVFCARDGKDLILSTDEAQLVCEETKLELGRSFPSYFQFPDRNVTVVLADKIHMNEVLQVPGFDRACPSVFGYMRSSGQGPAIKHSVVLLNGLPKGRLMATFAHELAHTWLNENVKANRRLGDDAREGFCELVAYRLMDSLNQERETATILANLYTRGQIGLFVETEKAYGIYWILEWLKFGVDSQLSADDLERIRRVQPPASSSILSQAYRPPSSGIQAPVPDHLTLVGISSSGSPRLALINNRSFQNQESARVRISNTNVLVRCLEVRAQSVIIQVNGSAQEQELFLKTR
jgi:hypothetical protein